jgi:hypothetical protein
MSSTQTAASLHAAIADALRIFEGADEARTTRPKPGGGWCARQILGHLIDSACNNHRRFILGQSHDFASYDGYDQNEWVARQHYENVPWRDLVIFWTSYNRHLAHVISRVPDDVASREALDPDGKQAITLAFLMDDYVRHLRHHLVQIDALLTG